MPHTTSIGSLHKAVSHSPLRGASPVNSVLPHPSAHVGGLRNSASVILSQDTELQKALAEEKLRSDQHRNHYQMLKGEHTKLQDNYAKLEVEFQTSLETERQAAERLRRSLSESQRVCAELKSEVDQLKEDAMTPQRLEILRLKVGDEIEAVYKDRFSRLTAENDAYRADYNRLRYEQSFLKSEFEHQAAEHARVAEERRLIHEAECANLRREREELIASKVNSTQEESQRVKALHKENAQLTVRLKATTTELEDLRAQREQSGNLADTEARSQARQLSDATSSLRQLQTEKDSVRQQVELLQREINQLQLQSGQQTSRVHELEKENTLLKHRVDEVNHKGQLNLANLKLEMTRTRGEVERQRDQVAAQVEDLQYQLELSRAKVAALEKNLREKEQEISQREAAAREEEWQRVTELEREKGDLEEELAAEKRRQVEAVASQSGAVERAEERMRAMETELKRMEAEREGWRRRMETAEAEGRGARETEMELREALEKAEAEAEESGRLRERMERAEAERGALKERCEEAERSKEHLLSTREMAWREDRDQLASRVRELETEMSGLHEKAVNLDTESKRRKKRYARYIVRLRQQMELATAKQEELQAENELMKRNVPFEEFSKLKKQLKEMKQRHQEFRDLLMTAPCTEEATKHVSEEDHEVQEDIRLLRDRLEQLDARQREQMVELNALRLAPSCDVEEAGEDGDH